MEKRNFNYKDVISNDGSFSLKVRDKKIAKKLDAICFIKNINKTKFCLNAIENAINIEYEKINNKLNKEGEE